MSLVGITCAAPSHLQMTRAVSLPAPTCSHNVQWMLSDVSSPPVAYSVPKCVCPHTFFFFPPTHIVYAGIGGDTPSRLIAPAYTTAFTSECSYWNTKVMCIAGAQGFAFRGDLLTMSRLYSNHTDTKLPTHTLPYMHILSTLASIKLFYPSVHLHSGKV